jgi:hypothetical protein
MAPTMTSSVTSTKAPRGLFFSSWIITTFALYLFPKQKPLLNAFRVLTHREGEKCPWGGARSNRFSNQKGHNFCICFSSLAKNAVFSHSLAIASAKYYGCNSWSAVALHLVSGMWQNTRPKIFMLLQIQKEDIIWGLFIMVMYCIKKNGYCNV